MLSVMPRASSDGTAMGLEFLLVLLFFDALVGGGGALLLELLSQGAMKFLLEDRIGLDGLELGLEVLHVVSGRVASTAGIGHVGPNVFKLITGGTPIASRQRLYVHNEGTEHAVRVG